LLGKEPADPTILKSADIGITVQGYNADTVIDSEYGADKLRLANTSGTNTGDQDLSPYDTHIGDFNNPHNTTALNTPYSPVLPMPTGTDTVADGLEFLNSVRSRYIGLVTKPTITDNGVDTITIGSAIAFLCNCEIFDENTRGNNMTLAETSLTLAINNQVYYVIAKRVGETATYELITDRLLLAKPNKTLVAVAIRTGTTFHISEMNSLGSGLPEKTQQLSIQKDGFGIVSGLGVSANTRVITVDSGLAFYGSTVKDLTACVSDIDNIRFYTWNGSTYTFSTTTLANNTQYNGATALANLTGNKFNVNWLWRGVETQKHIYSTLSRDQYNSVAEAVASPVPAPPDIVLAHAVFVGGIVYRNGENAAQAYIVPKKETGTQLANIHNNLGGLNEGDFKHLTLAEKDSAIFAWVSNTNLGVYAIDSLVSYAGAIYKNITGTNTDTTPDLDTTNWELATGGGGYWTDTGTGFLTPTEPTNAIQLFEELVFTSGNQIRNGAFSNMTFNFRGLSYRFDSNGLSPVSNAMLGSIKPWTRIYGDKLIIGSPADISASVNIKSSDNTSATFAQKIDDSLNSPLLYVRNDGNVGIGTATPEESLDISGNLKITGYLFGGAGLSFPVFNNIQYRGLFPDGLYQTKIRSGNTDVAQFFSASPGNTGILIRKGNQNSFLTIGDGSEAVRAYLTIGDSTIENISSQSLNFTCDVGINTTTPTASLHIKGSGNTSATFAQKIDNSSNSPLLYVRDDGYVDLPNTTFANKVGIISKGGVPFIHDFNYGNNGTVTTSGSNTFIGENAGNFTMGSTATSIVHSSYNTSQGTLTLNRNTTGYYNSAQGWRAMYQNTTGHSNSAQGVYALTSNTIGNHNTAQGVNALYLNISGNNNSAHGRDALRSNTTGGSNTAQGINSLYGNTTASNNTASGADALRANGVGNNNTAIGQSAGRWIADGSTGLTTANQGVFLGMWTKALENNSTNEIVIGYNATGLEITRRL
jgi:hypothetical protein